MIHLNKFEEFTDSAILDFLYEIEKIDSHLSSDESWSQYIYYKDYDDDMCTMKLEFGSSGYSEGWSEDWNINWGDPEWIIVESNHSYSGPYGAGEEKKEVKFDSFNDLLDEIKQHFGL